MRDGIIYDCPNANCRTPIYTGKCSKACIEKNNKKIGIKPKTNADRIRAMSDEELADLLMNEIWKCDKYAVCKECPRYIGECCLPIDEWLQQPAEGE